MPMAAPKGTQPPGGSRKGVPNKIGADVRAMVLTALDRAGGPDYLLAQAHHNPKAFLTLLGRIIPTQITGKDDRDLIPANTVTPDRLASVLLALTEDFSRIGARREDSRSGDGEDDPTR